jgi:SNF2 family DNA or RNA helicase
MINFKLMKHQQNALTESFIEKNLFLAFQMGTGKTCTVLQILRHKSAEAERLKRTLILAPTVVLKNWALEIEKFTKIHKGNVFVLTGSGSKRAETIRKVGSKPAIFITNYEIMQNKDVLSGLLAYRPEVLICDESHYLKNFKSKRAMSVSRIAENAQNTFMLTGTPILNSSLDLFMQFKILDNGETFGSNYYSFRHQYFVDVNNARAGMSGYFPKFEQRKEAAKLLKEKMDKKMLVITKEECLDLPELVVQNIEVPLSKEQTSLYNAMKRDYIAFVESELAKGTKVAVVAQLAITKILRLQQIVSGFVKTEAHEIIKIKDVPRFQVLKDLIETISVDSKVIVWSIYRQNYEDIASICSELNIGYTEIHGGTKDKFAEAERFNTDPGIRVLIGNPGAGGVGINLVAASYMIYFSRGFKLGDDLQSEARNHRKGSEVHEKITRINLVAPGTVDELISDALKNKQDISKEIIGWNKKL